MGSARCVVSVRARRGAGEALWFSASLVAIWGFLLLSCLLVDADMCERSVNSMSFAFVFGEPRSESGFGLLLHWGVYVRHPGDFPAR